jgi:hypothetical protein
MSHTILQGLDPLIFIANLGSQIRIPLILLYRISWIPDPDPFIFIADPRSRIRIILFYCRSWILLFYRGAKSSHLIVDPGSVCFYRGSKGVLT